MPDAVHRRIRRAVYGEDYPEGVDPYSFISRSELDLLATQLRLGPGDLFADLGCGRGGPGLWLAAKTGADLVGVDISAVAVQAATARAGDLGLGGRARLQLGSFADTGPDTGGVAALTHLDALTFSPH